MSQGLLPYNAFLLPTQRLPPTADRAACRARPPPALRSQTAAHLCQRTADVSRLQALPLFLAGSVEARLE